MQDAPRRAPARLAALGAARQPTTRGRRSWPVVVLLVVLAIPLLTLHLGQTDDGALPTDTQARQAYDRMSAGFGAGSNGPMLVAVDLSQAGEERPEQLDQINQQEQQQKQKAQSQASQQEQQIAAAGGARAGAGRRPAAGAGAGPADARPAGQQITSQADSQRKKAVQLATDPRLQQLRTDLQKTSDVKSVTQPLVNEHGTAAVYTLIADSAPSSRRTEDLVNTLRDTVIPKATKGQGMTADVGGTTAGYIDLAKQITRKLPLVIAIVLALSFVLLALAFRSLLVPLKAVVMNLLSIARGVRHRHATSFGHDWSATLRRARRRRSRSSPTCR